MPPACIDGDSTVAGALTVGGVIADPTCGALMVAIAVVVLGSTVMPPDWIVGGRMVAVAEAVPTDTEMISVVIVGPLMVVGAVTVPTRTLTLLAIVGPLMATPTEVNPGDTIASPG